MMLKVTHVKVVLFTRMLSTINVLFSIDGRSSAVIKPVT